MEGKERVQLYFLWQCVLYTFDVSLSVPQRCGKGLVFICGKFFAESWIFNLRCDKDISFPRFLNNAWKIEFTFDTSEEDCAHF